MTLGPPRVSVVDRKTPRSSKAAAELRRVQGRVNQSRRQIEDHFGCTIRTAAGTTGPSWPEALPSSMSGRRDRDRDEEKRPAWKMSLHAIAQPSKKANRPCGGVACAHPHAIDTVKPYNDTNALGPISSNAPSKSRPALLRTQVWKALRSGYQEIKSANATWLQQRLDGDL